MPTPAGKFIHLVRQQARTGVVTLETAQHFVSEFRKLSWQADNATLAASVSRQIERLQREADALRTLSAECFTDG